MNDSYPTSSKSGYKVYHVRGVYYTNYYASDGDPVLLGKEILAEIPKEPAEYNDWKVLMLLFFGSELKRIRRIERERVDMLREPVWGRHYVSKPSRVLRFNKRFTWAYIVDIDTDRLIILGSDTFDSYFCGSVFRLNQVPRELFNHPDLFEASGGLTCAHPIISTDVKDEYAPPLRPRRRIDTEGQVGQPGKGGKVSLTISQGYSFSVREARISTAWSGWLSRDNNEDGDSAQLKDHSTLWKSLRLLLLRQFLHRYNCTTKVYSSYTRETKSFFVFRQLVYALVSIAHDANVIRFRERPASYERGIGAPIDATPSWEPPPTDHYWIGNVLIVLDPDMDRREDHHAVLVDAILQVQERETITALVFSTSDVIAFEINRSSNGVHISQGSGRGSVFGTPQTPCCICCCMYEPTPSFLLLIDLLSSTSVKAYPPCSYPALPVEICEAIYDYAPTATKRVLRATCRLFNSFFQRINRDIQVGKWRLKSPNRCPSRYSGISDEGTSLENVDLKTGHIKGKSGYEVGLFTERGTIELDLSLFGVVKAVGEDCCKNYPETEDSSEGQCPTSCTIHYHPDYPGIPSRDVGLCGDVLGLWGGLGHGTKQRLSGIEDEI